MPIVIRPLSDRVVVIPDPPDEMARFNIHIPKMAQDAVIPQTGTVIAAGPGKVSEFPILHPEGRPGPVADTITHESYVSFNRMPMHIGEGSRVMFVKNAGSEVTIGREKFIVLRQTEVLGLLEEVEDEE